MPQADRELFAEGIGNMQYAELRNALTSSGAQVTISADTLTSNIATLLTTAYGGQPIVIGNVSAGSGDGENNTVVLVGTASFLGVLSLPVELRAWVDVAGSAQLLLRYTLRGPNPTATDWRFSRSFSDLPKTITGASGSPEPATSPLDELELSDTAYVVSSSARRDPLTNVELEIGINFVSQLRLTGVWAVLQSVFGMPTTTTLYGTIRIPKTTDLTSPLGLSQFAWDSLSAPGIRLRADLRAGISVGSLSLSDVNLRLYCPTSKDWLTKNATYLPLLGLSGSLRIPSADVTLQVTMFRDVDSGAIVLASAVSGVSLGSLSVLSDLAGTDQLLNQLPDQLKSVASALSSLELREVALSLVPGSSSAPPTLEWASATIGLANQTWQVVENHFAVSGLACRFDIVSPLASPSVSVKVTGVMQVMGVPIAVAASSWNGFLLTAELQTPQTIPIRQLMDTYAPSLPLQSDLSLSTLAVAIAPSRWYQFNLGLAQAGQPWTIDVGFEKLTIRDVVLGFTYPVGGSLSGFYAGTIAFGSTASLDIRYTIPGEFFVHGMFAEVNFRTLLSTLIGGSIDLPSGFDLTLRRSSVIIQRSGSGMVFQLGTQLDSAGALVFEARRIDGSWGFATGLSLSSKASLLPGLGALDLFENMFRLSKLLLVISTFADRNFAFLDTASFQDQGLGSHSFALPASAGLVSGFNLYGEWQIDTSDAKQSLLKNLLGLSATLSFVLQFGQNPAQQSRLQVGYSTQILGHPLVCTFGAELVNGQPQLFLSGRMDVSIQGTVQQFSVRMTFVSSGAQLAATMQGGQPISCGPFQIANLALQVGVNWAGIPSLGIAATIATTAFASSVALFFDSTNPAKSMIAGSVSNLTLKSVLDVLVGGFVPAVDAIFNEIALLGTQEFDLPLSLVPALDSDNIAQISQAFAAVGVTIPSSAQRVLLIRSTDGNKWYLTNLADRARQYQIVRSNTKLVGSVQAQFYFAPERTTIGDLPAFEPGFYLNAKLSVLGFSAQGTIDISTNRGIYVYARMDRLVIGSERLFSIQSVDGTSGPLLSASTFDRPADPVAEFRSPHLYVNGQITLLGLRKHVYVRLSRQMGFEFNLGGDLSPGVSFNLQGSFQSPTNFSVNGSFDAGIGTIDLGSLGRVPINTGVSGMLMIGFFGNVATVGISAGFRLGGQSLSIPSFTLNVQTEDLLNFAQLLAEKAKQVVLDLVGDAARWAKYVLDQVITGVVSVGNVLRDVYQKTAAQTAEIMKSVGYAASEVGSALQSAYSVTAEQAANILKSAGYVASEVGNVLKDVYGQTAEQAANILKNAGYVASDIGNVLKGVYSTTTEQTVSVLREIGAVGEDVVSWLKSISTMQPSDLATTLKGAGYAASEVSEVLLSGVGAVEGAVGVALRSAGFDPEVVMHSLPSFHTAMQQVASLKTWASGALSAEASHIAARITDATQSAANTAAAGLQSAGYDLATTGRTIATEIGRNFVLPAISAVYRISDVALYAKDVLQVPADQLASFFRSGLGFSSDQVKSILEGAGYAADQVSNALRSVYDWADNNLNPSKW